MHSEKERVMWQMLVWGGIFAGLSLLSSSLYDLSYDFRPIVIGVSVSISFVLSACLASLRTAITTSLFILLGSFLGGIVFAGTVVIGVVLVGQVRLENMDGS